MLARLVGNPENGTPIEAKILEWPSITEKSGHNFDKSPIELPLTHLRNLRNDCKIWKSMLEIQKA